jgi:hypothetical protein
MTSPDVSAMFSQFTGAPQTYAPGSYGSIYDKPAFPIAEVSPYSNNYVPTDNGKTLEAITKTGFAIGAAGRDIGGYRAESTMGKVAEKIAREKAFQITQAGLKARSRVAAITGTQGRTGAGSPLLAELATIQAAVTDSRTARYEGNVEKYQASARAKKYAYKAPADVLTALLEGSSLFKEKP